jgi:hypothetical protein
LVLPNYVTVYPYPGVPDITQIGNWLSVPAGFISYQWYNDQGPINGADSSAYYAAEAGTYHVVVTNEFGCEEVSNDLVFTGIATIGLNDDLQVYPNPTKSLLNVRSGSEIFSVRVEDASGRLMLLQEFNGDKSVSLNCEQFSAGAYLLTAMTRNGRVQTRFAVVP